MTDISQLRDKHWSGRKTLWPCTRCASDIKFNWSDCKINPQSFIAAQDDARDAVELHDDKYWNRAMYLLTDAYMGGRANEQWWQQWV